MNDPGRVLVVDDEPGITMVLTELLTGEGYHVRSTDDGREAPQLVAEWLPDAVVLDLTLPGIDGVEVARRIRDLPDARAARVAIIVVTGAHAGLRAASAIGAESAIRKPFDLDLVLNAVDSAVDGRKSR